MTRRSVARTYPEIILQAQNILTALRAYEVELGIHYNTAVRLEVELSAALGDPASASEGAQAELNERRGALSAARESRDATLAEVRAFCANAIDTVKPWLGRRWNAKWLAVGFTRRSLSIPREPAALLCDLRAYFLSHPGHESADLGLTAVGADELAATLNAARSAVAAGRAQRNEARSIRDEAIEQVRPAVVGVARGASSNPAARRSLLADFRLSPPNRQRPAGRGGGAQRARGIDTGRSAGDLGSGATRHRIRCHQTGPGNGY